jgi:hypothetical protein
LAEEARQRLRKQDPQNAKTAGSALAPGKSDHLEKMSGGRNA